VPSGQPLALWEVLWERVEGGGAQAVLRFLAPEVARDGGSVDAAAAYADLLALCESHGLPIAALPYGRAETLVVTLMDRPVARGVTDPDATQYFEVFAVTGGRCEGEAF
jgi:hypothetical protein